MIDTVEINYFYASMPNTATPIQNINFDTNSTTSVNIQLNAGIVYEKDKKLTIQFLLNGVINVAGNVPTQDSYIVENEDYRGVSVSAGLNIATPQNGSTKTPLKVIVIDLDTGHQLATSESNLHFTSA
ncbi:hypothetical protein AB3K25_04270 [Leuconostoc sp. MS02]|uniref:Uncharacterized protein n=1 Tax=Leuconostoc aquikimchii TaxID=3236804 RepID=A0ABV3S353_9LACO